jgi:hypothetical protein
MNKQLLKTQRNLEKIQRPRKTKAYMLPLSVGHLLIRLEEQMVSRQYIAGDLLLT